MCSMHVNKMKFERRSSLKYYHITCIGNKTSKLLRGLLAGFSKRKNKFCTCITPFFCTFRYRHCATTSWNFTILWLGREHARDSDLIFFFSELGCSLLEFNSRNILQRFTNWTRWKKREEVLSGANSLFNWRFRCRRNHAKALYFLKPRVKENIIKKIYSYWTVSQQSLAFVFFKRCRLS